VGFGVVLKYYSVIFVVTTQYSDYSDAVLNLLSFVTDCIAEKDNNFSHVRLFSLCRLNRPTFDLHFFVYLWVVTIARRWLKVIGQHSRCDLDQRQKIF